MFQFLLLTFTTFAPRHDVLAKCPECCCIMQMTTTMCWIIARNMILTFRRKHHQSFIMHETREREFFHRSRENSHVVHTAPMRALTAPKLNNHLFIRICVQFQFTTFLSPHTDHWNYDVSFCIQVNCWLRWATQSCIQLQEGATIWIFLGVECNFSILNKSLCAQIWWI